MPENTKAETEEISLQLDKILDECGFSKERVKERTLSMEKSSKAKCLSTQRILQRSDIVKIFVGSLREGTGIYYHSDCDILQIYTSVLCIEQEEQSYDQSKTVFQIEGETTPAGHYLLRLIHPSQMQRTSNDINHAFEEIEENWYLSSDKFMEKNDDVFATGKGWIPRSTSYQERRGPSIPKYTEPDILWSYILSSYSDLNLLMDFVRALPCQCPSIVKRWKERVRHHQWPSKADIEIAASMPACVVPVGHKGSELEHLQWRLCFTWAEMHLIKSMNNTHTKVHFLLKMIARYYLKPVCAEMKSYVVKNLMLWQAEGKPLEEFQPKHLIDRLADALRFLKDCIYKKQLQNYMQPERNLLGRISDEEVTGLLDKIEQLLENLQSYTQCFVYTPDKITATVTKILESVVLANYLERVLNCIESTFSVTELADYYEKLFYHKWYWYSFLYNITFVTSKCLSKFGRAVYNDPLGIEHEKLISYPKDFNNNLEETLWERSAMISEGSQDKVTADSNTTDKNCSHDKPTYSDVSFDKRSETENESYEETTRKGKAEAENHVNSDKSFTGEKTRGEYHKSTSGKQTKSSNSSPKPNKNKSANRRKNKHKRQSSFSKKKEGETVDIFVPNEIVVTSHKAAGTVTLEILFPIFCLVLILYRQGLSGLLIILTNPFECSCALSGLIVTFLFTIKNIKLCLDNVTEESFTVKLTKKVKRGLKKRFQQGRSSVLCKTKEHEFIIIS